MMEMMLRPKDKTKENKENIVFLILRIYGAISEAGRVRVTFYNSHKNYSLDITRIKEIFYDGKAYYIVYETSNADFYRQKFAEDIVEKPYGVKVNTETANTYVCPVCGTRTEIDDWAMWTDEGIMWCPRCNDYVRPEYRKALVVEVPDVDFEYKIAKQIAEERGFRVRELPAAHGIERHRIHEEIELPSGISVRIAEGMLVKYDEHAWSDGIDVKEKEIGPVRCIIVDKRTFILERL